MKIRPPPRAACRKADDASETQSGPDPDGKNRSDRARGAAGRRGGAAADGDGGAGGGRQPIGSAVRQAGGDLPADQGELSN